MCVNRCDLLTLFNRENEILSYTRVLFFIAKVSMAYMHIYGEDYEQGQLVSYHLNHFVHHLNS